LPFRGIANNYNFYPRLVHLPSNQRNVINHNSYKTITIFKNANDEEHDNHDSACMEQNDKVNAFPSDNSFLEIFFEIIKSLLFLQIHLPAAQSPLRLIYPLVLVCANLVFDPITSILLDTFFILYVVFSRALLLDEDEERLDDDEVETSVLGLNDKSDRLAFIGSFISAGLLSPMGFETTNAMIGKSNYTIGSIMTLILIISLAGIGIMGILNINPNVYVANSGKENHDKDKFTKDNVTKQIMDDWDDRLENSK